MDPTRLLKPKGWKSYGGYAVALLVVAAVMALAGAVASTSGRDPSTAYRLAALAGAGAAMLGIIWVGGKGMDRTTGR